MTKNRPNLFSERLDRAIALSARAHDGQARKGTDIPYFSHPVHVAMLLAKAGADEDLVIAGLLHDVLEDTDVSAAELEAEFGAAVVALVNAVTETKKDGGGVKRPWKVRKEEQIEHLRAESDLRVVRLKAADTSHNCWTIIEEHARVGDAVWKKFKAGPDLQSWRMTTVSELIREKLGPDDPLADEIDAAASRLREIAEQAGR